jgi:protein CpxP
VGQAWSSIPLDSLWGNGHDAATKQGETKNMKKRTYLFTAALCSATFVLLALTSYGQKAGAISKAEAISQQLGLTPEQKIKILPILRDEAPKVAAIKNDNSLSKIQKVQQIRAIHQQTDPQMKAILTPAQYEKLKTIRQQAIRDAVQSRSPS